MRIHMNADLVFFTRTQRHTGTHTHGDTHKHETSQQLSAQFPLAIHKPNHCQNRKLSSHAAIVYTSIYCIVYIFMYVCVCVVVCLCEVIREQRRTKDTSRRCFVRLHLPVLCNFRRVVCVPVCVCACVCVDVCLCVGIR